MGYKTQPAQGYKKLTSFVADQTPNARAAYPVGGAQFVFTGKDGVKTTVLAADYDTFFKLPTEVVTIHSDTDCTAVHIWL